MSITSAPEHLPTPAQELNLKDYLDVVRRRKAVFFQTFALILAAGIIVTFLSKPVYKTRAKLVVPMPSNTMTIQQAQDPLNPVMIGTQPDPISTQLEVLQSREFRKAAMEKAGIKTVPGVIPPAVHTENLERTNVIQISVEGGSPPDIQRLADTIVKLHMENMEDESSRGVREALKFVQARKDEAEDKLEGAENALAEFRKRYRVRELEQVEVSRARELADLEAGLRTAQSNIELTNVKLADYRAKLRQEPPQMVDETFRPNPQVERLQLRIYELKARREELLTQFREGSRQVLDQDGLIAKAEADLATTPAELPTRTYSANPARSLLQTRIADLETTLMGQQQEYNATAARLRTVRSNQDTTGTWEIDHSRLTRERDLAQSNYVAMMEHLRQLEIRSKTRLSGLKVIESANLPTVPIKPRREVNLALTTLLALFLATGMALLQEYLDDRINTPDDVERVSALPTLGHVPLMEGNTSQLVNELAANSHVAEAYRGLRSGVGFAALDAPIRRLQVTSASKGDGKSTTAANLAVAMAMDGKRVILVDADLRRPSAHRLMQTASTPGLSELLVGMKTIEEVLQPTEVENLQFIPAGPIPPNPAELLGSAAFSRIIEQLEERADVVIYDTPPCVPVTDPLIVASQMDGVVLVLSVGQTRRAVIKHTVQQLTRARARIVGVVLNRVQTRKGSSYYHYYYYSGDGYYAETAERGRSHRRNGKRSLGSGKVLAGTSSRDRDDEV